jgi:hypothetical protein
VCKKRRQVSGRERLATQKRRISTCDRHELTDATRTDATHRDLAVHNKMSVHWEMSFDRDLSLERNGICVGEHSLEVARLSQGLPRQSEMVLDTAHNTYVCHGSPDETQVAHWMYQDDGLLSTRKGHPSKSEECYILYIIRRRRGLIRRADGKRPVIGA